MYLGSGQVISQLLQAIISTFNEKDLVGIQGPLEHNEKLIRK